MKTLRTLFATIGAGLACGAAQAGGINWSIGINLPPVATVISNGPGYVHSPYYAPAPVYVPPPVVYRPAPIYYAPPPAVVYAPVPPRYVHERHWRPHPHRHWHRSDHYGPRHDRGGRWRDRD